MSRSGTALRPATKRHRRRVFVRVSEETRALWTARARALGFTTVGDWARVELLNVVTPYHSGRGLPPGPLTVRIAIDLPFAGQLEAVRAAADEAGESAGVWARAVLIDAAAWPIVHSDGRLV